MQPTWIVIFHILAASSATQLLESQVYEEDPCLKHRQIDASHRSPLHRPSSPRDVICDHQLTPGWYKFTAAGQPAEMPITCPPLGYCGTHAPIWLRLNTTQGADVTNAYACVSGEVHNDVTSQYDCCMYSWPVRLRHCESGFTVYHLQPSTSCNMAYCAHTKEDATLFSKTPDICAVIHNNRVYLNCSFQTSPHVSSKHFKISWFKLTSEGSHVSVTSEQPITSRHGLLDVTRYLLPGEEVQCEVELMSKGYSVTSLPYFVGLHVNPDSVTLTPERSQVTLEVTKTLPLLCKECDIKVKFSTVVKQGVDSSILFSTCNASISNNLTHVMTRVKSRDSGHASIHVVVTRGADSWWAQHPPVIIDLKMEGMRKQHCHIFTQNHVISFNRHSFDLKTEGIFTVFRDNSSDIQVEVRSTLCPGNERGSCICGMAARQGASVVRLDKCGLDIPVLNVRSKDNNVRVLESRHGKVLTMLFSSGWLVRTHAAQFGLSLTVTSPHDITNAEGVCVLHDNNVIGEQDWSLPESSSLLYTSDDEEFKSTQVESWCDCESSLPSCNPPHQPGLIRSYLDITEEVLSGSENSQHYSVVDHKGLTIPSENDVYFEVHEMPLPSRESVQESKRQRGLGRGFEWDLGSVKRDDLESTTIRDDTATTDLTTNDNEVTTQVYLTTERTLEFEISENDAHSICLNSLLNSSLGRACADILESQDLLFSIQMCVNDVSVHGETWSKFSVPLLEDMCELESGSSPPPTLIDALNCPGSCSGHGVCLELGCICDPGYSKHDCSQLSALSPMISAIGEHGQCDIANIGHCHKAPVKGEGFARASTLRCKISRSEEDRSANQVLEYPSTANHSVYTMAQFISTNHITCVIPQDRISSLQTTALLVSVTNDGLHFSNAASVFVFDSRCASCNEARQCTAKNNICVIDSMCFTVESHKPGDACLKCQPRISNTTWTKASSVPRFTSQNEPVSAVSLRAFLGQELVHQFSTVNPEGVALRFSLVVPVHLARHFEPRISNDGELRWRANTEGSRTLTVSAVTSCNVTSHLRVVIVTSRCPCLNSGVCTLNLENMVACSCRRGYYGWRCERQEVTSSCGVCGAHGRCIPGRGCRCEQGYSGPWCTSRTSPCTLTSCPLGATCLPLSSGTFRCSFCPWRHSAQGKCYEPTKKYSFSTPRCMRSCSNGGRCVAHNTCACTRGWTGNTCQTAVCDPKCENGGVCWKPNRCSCPQGYRGRRCNKPICIPSCKGSGMRCVAPNTCQPKLQHFKHNAWFQQNLPRKTSYHRSS